MNVLHINRNYMTSSLHQTMISHLKRDNLSHTVFSPIDDINKAIIQPNQNVIAVACFSKLDRYLYNLKQQKIYNALMQNVNIFEYDLIHAYTLFTDGNCAMNLSKKYNIPYIVTIRNTDIYSFFKKMPFLRTRGIEIMKNASAIVFISEPYKSTVFEKYVPNDIRLDLDKKTYIIPNGIEDFWLLNKFNDISKDRVKRIESKQLRLLYTGRIDKNKNIISTIKAMNVLRKKGWNIKLTIVGRIDSEKEYKVIRNNPNVDYYKSCPKEKLINYYRQSDVFVMPSHRETFGLVYAEAMSQGLPVIYTKGQGFDGQFEEGLVGYHVDDRNYMTIAEKIEKIVDRYSEISENCIKNCTFFSWKDICKKYIDIYDVVK